MSMIDASIGRILPHSLDGLSAEETRHEGLVMDIKDGDRGHATIEPFEPVMFDAERATRGLPAWKGEHCGYYLDCEVQPIESDPK